MRMNSGIRAQMRRLGTLSLLAPLLVGVPGAQATRIVWTPPCEHAQMQADTCQVVRVDLQMTISGDMREFSVIPVRVIPGTGYGEFAKCVARKWKHYPRIPAPEWKPGVQTVTYTVSMGKACPVAP